MHSIIERLLKIIDQNSIERHQEKKIIQTVTKKKSKVTIVSSLDVSEDTVLYI
jgi:hypothetical protein